MKKWEEMWSELAPYLTCERGLDEGFADGKYTRFFARYCKAIDGIDISEDFYAKAKENLKDLDNVTLHIMDARKTTWSDKYFNVILNTSFHEFDLSGYEEFKLDYDLKTKMLEEMVRLSDTIVFAEVTPENLSGPLYQIFNPIEDHSLRIAKSNELIDKVLKEKGYEVVLEGIGVDEIRYNSREEFLEDMLSWWAEVKVPKDDAEKQSMIKQIAEILERKNFLTDLCFYDDFRYVVYKKKIN